MSNDIHDYSRVDRYMAARRRTMLLHAAWRPALAGAAGAAVLVLAAFAGAYMAGPTLRTHVVEIPVLDVRHSEVTVPDVRVVPREVEIPVPRVVSRETPRSEQEFVESPAYRDAGVKGRFAGPDQNGFRLEGGETFYPSRFVNGAPELAADLMDDVAALSRGDPIYCAPIAPAGLYQCQAWHAGRVVRIEAIPVGRGS
jgi:hypothetical protein